MKKANVLQKTEDYKKIVTTVKPEHSKLFKLYFEKTEGNFLFGIVVSKKIGNAVSRNKIKRRIKNILDQIKFKEDFICIIVCKEEIKTATYAEIKKELENKLIGRRT